MIKEIIEPVVKALVDHPEEVDIVEHTILEGKKVSVVVTVHPEDLGKVVGRRGGNANALRVLLSSLAGKHACTYTLDFGGKHGGDA